MEHFKTFKTEIYHLARLALSGRRQDIELYINRLSRKLKKIAPEVSESLNDLLFESPTRNQPTRSKSVPAIPVDIDSRLQLARHEYPIELDFEPIWTNPVSNKLNQIISERLRWAELSKADLLPTRSILFTGPPGVGKSLAARWISQKLNLPLVILDLSAVMSSFLGRTGNNVRHLLDYSKSTKCVLLLDEFDAIAKRRDDSTEIGELKRLVTVLLQEIDDWPHTGILISATNHPSLLDPAVWRRFDMIIDFPMPDENQIGKAVELFGGALENHRNIMFDLLTPAFKGLSFGEIEKELLRIRRESIISNKPLEDCILPIIKDNFAKLSKVDKAKLAAKLVSSGHSQRSVSKWTGLHRSTIKNADIKYNPE